jgi:23S rRNA pseudouridine1911/1915/1917 synthase
MKVFTAREADAGLRADIFIARQYPDFSRSSLDGLFDNGLVKAGQKPVKNSYKVKPGDEFRVDDRPLFKKPAKINLPVIYEDDDVIVIDKPPGVLTHSKGALNTEATVASFIAPKLAKDMPESNRAGIVHRLDRATSGVIITAKNQSALLWLQKQFSTRKTKKEYQAIAEGKLDPPAAVIDAPIARNPKKPQTFYVYPAGKPAQTEYRLLKILNKSSIYSLVELRPLTGRTHQLRVHMAYIGHPIVGDSVYGQGGEHLYLHAKSLELTLPGGRRRVFRAAAPVYFKEFDE